MEKKRLIVGIHLLEHDEAVNSYNVHPHLNWVFICGNRRKSPVIQVCSCSLGYGNSGKNPLSSEKKKSQFVLNP